MKATVFGGAMVDSIALLDDDRIERMAMDNAGRSYLLVEEGRKVEAREISQHVGGGGVNAAVALARLGLDVAAVVSLGQDARAERILRRLEDEGVSTRWALRDPRAATGAATMVAAHDRDAAIFTFRGANTLLSPEMVRPEMTAADLVYVAGLSNEAAECFPHILRLARAAGAETATNPGLRQIARRGDALADALAEITLLSLNRSEAAALAPRIVERFGEGGPALATASDADGLDLARDGFHSGGLELSLAKYFASLRALGVRRALVTDGRRGAYASDGERIWRAAPAPATVVGTAGAGDAFAATFAAWSARTGDLGAALQAAALNAASVVGALDTQSGLMRRDALDTALARGDGPPLIEWTAPACL